MMSIDALISESDKPKMRIEKQLEGVSSMAEKLDRATTLDEIHIWGQPRGDEPDRKDERPRKRLRWVYVALAIAWVGSLILLLGIARDATAATPAWDVQGHHGPSTFQAGDIAQYSFIVNNVGDGPATGPAQMEIRLPPGVTLRTQPGFAGDQTWFGGLPGIFNSGWDCGPSVAGASTLTCRSIVDPVQPSVRPFAQLVVYVAIAPGTTGDLPAVATVSGGSADTVTVTELAKIGPEPTQFGIMPGSFRADVYDRAGNPERRAGVEPFRATVGFDVNLKRTFPRLFGFLPIPSLEPIDNLRNLDVTLPRGFIGNPQAAAQCEPRDFSSGARDGVGSNCPAESQVGVAQILFQPVFGAAAPTNFFVTPVYNLRPPNGQPVDFGFVIQARPVHIYAELDPKDYSIVTTITDVNELQPVHGTSVTFWGDPADPTHDTDRWDPVNRTWGMASRAPKARFLELPSECDVTGTTKAHATSWGGASDPPAGAFAAGARIESAPQKLHSCERQRFSASLESSPETSRTDAPTGLGVRLNVDLADPTAETGTPPLRTAIVKLPEGLSVSPSAATGLGGCALSEIKLHTNDEATCPDASKIGTVSVTTPLLAEPLEGSVYLARQRDNPFNSLIAIYIVARGPGVIVKLPGKVTTNGSADGQLTARFDDNPQVPFSRFDLTFKGGPRGSLATPTTCGTKTTDTQMVAWNGVLPTVVTTSSFNASADGKGAPCPTPQSFDPNFDAGVTNPIAGANSSFTLTFGRPDQHQYLNNLTTTLPQGLLARIASATLCDDGAANLGACPPASLMGSVTVAAGPGSSPFWLSGGRAYITRGYKGAPFGLMIAIRALAGPFDLGEVIVRGSINVDPATAQVTIVSDPMPSQLEGIPLRVRTVNVNVDRPNFIINPTSCAVKSVEAQIGSVQGTTAAKSSRFQVGRCDRLPLRPKLRIEIGRRGHTGREATTPLKVTMTQTPGQSGLRSVKVDLPTTVNARLPVVNRACTLAAFNAGNCGAGALIGSATAVTPILRDPLRGQVFFVRSGIRRLPDMMIALRGQVGINLGGKVSIPGGRRLATAFDTIPDAPITKFTLKLVDGRNGPVGAVSNLCVARNRKPPANIEIQGQTGQTLRYDQKLVIKGCGRGRTAARTGRGRAGRGRRGSSGRGRRGRR
jgi:hypothetical protein